MGALDEGGFNLVTLVFRERRLTGTVGKMRFAALRGKDDRRPEA